MKKKIFNMLFHVAISVLIFMLYFGILWVTNMLTFQNIFFGIFIMGFLVIKFRNCALKKASGEL